MLFENRRSWLAVRNLVPLCLLSLITAPIPASFSVIPTAHAQEQLWIRQFGTTERDYAYGLASDGAGGVFIGGRTAGSLGGPNAGQEDVFLARFGGAGEQLWIIQLGTDNSESAWALAPDGSGGVFVTGWTHTNLGGPNLGMDDVFLARYDGDGTQIWIRQFGTDSFDFSHGLAPDGAGGVFVAGWTQGSFGPPNAGRYDAFVAHYSGAGDQLWVTQFGTSENDEPQALTPNGSGGVYVGGMTQGNLGGPNAGQRDVFLARLDGAGNRSWVRQLGTTENDSGPALAPDGSGGVFLGGGTLGSLGRPNSGFSDSFLARYDGAGNRLWIRQFGTSGTEVATALAPDGAGGVIVAGHTTGSLGGRPNAGGFDAFLARYDGTGDQLWIRQFGTPQWDHASALAPDGGSGFFVGGFSEGSLGGQSAGLQDAWIARFGDACYADCDQSGALDIFDFLCFQNSFVAGEPYACDCNPDPACNIFDFLCFQNAFVSGCP